MFLPQQPYMLLGTLREQVCYPNSQDDFDYDEINKALDKVGLSQLTKDHNVNEIKDWTRVLSCLLYTSPSPRDGLLSRMPSSA